MGLSYQSVNHVILQSNKCHCSVTMVYLCVLSVRDTDELGPRFTIDTRWGQNGHIDSGELTSFSDVFHWILIELNPTARRQELRSSRQNFPSPGSERTSSRTNHRIAFALLKKIYFGQMWFVTIGFFANIIIILCAVFFLVKYTGMYRFDIKMCIVVISFRRVKSTNGYRCLLHY